MDDTFSLTISELALDPDTGWACGSFGAVAEFVRDPGEGTERLNNRVIEVITSRGALRVEPSTSLRIVAYETPARAADGWNQGIALCLPRDDCAMNGRTVLTELGPDTDAPREEDRDNILFDMGLGLLQVDACLRSNDPETIGRLRAGLGHPLFVSGNPLLPHLVALSPQRVFISRVGRAEVYQPIPAPDQQSPDGPHTHVLPKLMAHNLTHAANIPIPDGWVPCMSAFPPSPLRDAFGKKKPFDRMQHDRFQAIWKRFAEPELVAIKASIAARGSKETDGSEVQNDLDFKSRKTRAAAKVALRQMKWRNFE